MSIASMSVCAIVSLFVAAIEDTPPTPAEISVSKLEEAVRSGVRPHATDAARAVRVLDAGAAAVARLETLLKPESSATPASKRAAVLALGELGPVAIPTLVLQIDRSGGDSELRLLSIRSVGLAGRGAAVDESTIERLERLLKRDTSVPSKVAALFALSRMRPTPEQARRAWSIGLADKDPSVRRAAIGLLRSVGPEPSDLSLLIERLRADSDADTRVEARSALIAAAMSREETRRSLLANKSLSEPDREAIRAAVARPLDVKPEVDHASVIDALADPKVLDDHATLARLAAATRDPNRSVREAARRAVKRLISLEPANIKRLVDSIEFQPVVLQPGKTDDGFSMSVTRRPRPSLDHVTTFFRVLGPESRPVLVTLLNDPSPRTRIAATRLLIELDWSTPDLAPMWLERLRTPGIPLVSRVGDRTHSWKTQYEDATEEALLSLGEAGLPSLLREMESEFGPSPGSSFLLQRFDKALAPATPWIQYGNRARREFGRDGLPVRGYAYQMAVTAADGSSLAAADLFKHDESSPDPDEPAGRKSVAWEVLGTRPAEAKEALPRIVANLDDASTFAEADALIKKLGEAARPAIPELFARAVKPAVGDTENYLALVEAVKPTRDDLRPYIDRLGTFAKEGGWNTRASAFRLLAIAGDDAREVLSQALASENTYVSRHAARTLASLGTLEPALRDRVVSCLARSIREGADSERRESVEALHQITDPDQRLDGEFARLSRDPDASVRNVALESLAVRGKLTEQNERDIIRWAEEGDVRIIELLPKLISDESVRRKVIVDALRSDSDDVRGAALSAAESMGTGAPDAVVRGVLDAARHPLPATVAMGQGIAGIGIRSGFDGSRARAVRVAGAIAAGRPEFVPDFLALLGRRPEWDHELNMRTSVRDAIAKLDVPMEEMLKRLVQDRDPQIREDAELILARLGSSSAATDPSPERIERDLRVVERRIVMHSNDFVYKYGSDAEERLLTFLRDAAINDLPGERAKRLADAAWIAMRSLPTTKLEAKDLAETAAPALQAALECDGTPWRNRAARLIARLPETPAWVVPGLRGSLTEGRGVDRVWAAVALARRPEFEPEDHAAFAAALGDSDAATVEIVALALGARGATGRDLLKSALPARPAEVLWGIAALGAQAQPLGEELFRLASDGASSTIRTRAARALRFAPNLDRHRVAALVNRALSSDDSEWIAGLELVEANDPLDDATIARIARGLDSSRGEELRCRVAVALGRLGERAEGVAPLLAKAASGGETRPAMYALNALRKVGARRDTTVPIYVEALRSKDDAIRRQALLGLRACGLGAHPAADELARLIGDPSTPNILLAPAARIFTGLKQTGISTRPPFGEAIRRVLSQPWIGDVDPVPALFEGIETFGPTREDLPGLIRLIEVRPHATSSVLPLIKKLGPSAASAIHGAVPRIDSFPTALSLLTEGWELDPRAPSSDGVVAALWGKAKQPAEKRSLLDAIASSPIPAFRQARLARYFHRIGDAKDRTIIIDEISEWVPSPETWNILGEALHDQPEVREKAIESLGSMGTIARRTAPALQSMLATERPAVRLKIALALYQIENDRSAFVAEFRQALRSRETDRVVSALVSLRRVPKVSDELVPDVIEVLHSGEPQARLTALGILPEMGPRASEAVGELVALHARVERELASAPESDSLDPSTAEGRRLARVWTRSGIIDALGRIGGKSNEAESFLRDRLRSGDADTRTAAAVALVRSGTAIAGELRAFIEADLRETPSYSILDVLTERKPDQAAFAIEPLIAGIRAGGSTDLEMLAKIGPDDPRVLDLLKERLRSSSNDEIASLLGKLTEVRLKGEHLLPEVLPMLNDDRIWNREAAAQFVLKYSDDPSLIDVAVRRIAEYAVETNLLVADPGDAALRRPGTARELVPILEKVVDKRSLFSLSAASLIERISPGDPRGLPALERGLASNDHSVRHDAVHYLATLPRGERVAELIRNAALDPSPLVRSKAARVVESFK